jgi:heptosyltransferase-2
MDVAVFLPNWIGDAVMATPALRALRRRFAGSKIVAVARPYVAGVLEGADWFDEILLAGRGWSGGVAGLAARLRRRKIGLAVLFPNSFRSALTAWLGGCRRRVGLSLDPARRYLLTDALKPVRDAAGKRIPSPALDDYNRIAVQAGCTDPGHELQLFTTPDDEAAADRVWRAGGLNRFPRVVCLNGGGAFGPAKQWPLEHFVQLARDFAARGWGVLTLCGPAEKDFARRLAENVASPGVQSLGDLGPLSLGLSKACVRRCDLLVTTDSGPRHFAAAFGRPVVTLFGPTHIAWTETYHPLAVHLQKQVDCGPCQRRVCPLDHRCMTRLTPAEASAAAEGLLRTAA